MELFNVSPGVAIVGGILTGLVALFVYNKVTGDWFMNTNVFSVFFTIGGSVGLGLFLFLVLPTFFIFRKMSKWG